MNESVDYKKAMNRSYTVKILLILIDFNVQVVN